MTIVGSQPVSWLDNYHVASYYSLILIYNVLVATDSHMSTVNWFLATVSYS